MQTLGSQGGGILGKMFFIEVPSHCLKRPASTGDHLTPFRWWDPRRVYTLYHFSTDHVGSAGGLQSTSSRVNLWKPLLVKNKIGAAQGGGSGVQI